MKTKKNVASSNKKCTCSAIQQCDMHRVSRIPKTDADNAAKQSKHNGQTNKRPLKK